MKSTKDTTLNPWKRKKEKKRNQQNTKNLLESEGDLEPLQTKGLNATQHYALQKERH